MSIEKTAFYNNPFIGLFIKANEEIALVPKNIHSKLLSKVEEVLKVEPVPMFLCQSPILGIFSALNSHGCVVSALADRNEVKPLKEKGLNVFFLDERYAPGNNILANDHGALVNPRISHNYMVKIADCLDVEVFSHPIASLATVGATNAVTNNGLFANRDLSEIEMKMLEKIFKVKGVAGTVNLGSTANSYGVVANTKGALTGEATSGAEIQRIYEALFG